MAHLTDQEFRDFFTITKKSTEDTPIELRKAALSNTLSKLFEVKKSLPDEVPDYLKANFDRVIDSFYEELKSL